MKQEGVGSLPERCPSCKKDVVWDWGTKDVNDEGVQQLATCPSCKEEFFEFYEIAGWSVKL